MRLAIVGAGGMGSFHARSLAALPDVEIVAIADVRQAAARALSDEVGGTPTADGCGRRRCADLDGLVIASPEDSHEALVHAAFAKGTCVLCEKPLAVGVGGVPTNRRCRGRARSPIAATRSDARVRPCPYAAGGRSCPARRVASRPLRAPQRARGSPNRATDTEPVGGARHPFAALVGRP